jgi:hypothetical protein
MSHFEMTTDQSDDPRRDRDLSQIRDLPLENREQDDVKGGGACCTGQHLPETTLPH